MIQANREPTVFRPRHTSFARFLQTGFGERHNEHHILPEYLSVAADFVIEIVSGDRTRDRGAKFNEYEAGGVGEYWILDPARNRAEFYLRDSAGVFAFKPQQWARTGARRIPARPIPGVVIDLGWLWQRPMPSVTEPLRAWGIVL